MKDKDVNYFIPNLFPEYFSETVQTVVNKKQREQREFKKSKNFGFELCSSAVFCGPFGIPLIKKYTKE